MTVTESPFSALIDEVRQRAIREAAGRPKPARPPSTQLGTDAAQPAVDDAAAARAGTIASAASRHSPFAPLIEQIRLQNLRQAASRPKPTPSMPRTGIPAFVAEIRAVSAPSVAMRKRRSALLPASAVLHALLVGAMIVIPLLSPEELPPPPEGGLKAFFVQPAAAPPPPPPPPGPAPVGKPMPKAVASAPPTFTAPIEVPQEVKPEQRLDVGVADGVPGGVVGGVVGGLPDVAPTPQAPVLVGGAIRAPKQLKWVEPVYPDLAIRSSVEGVIIIECTIDPAGRVSHARVLRGVPILDDAALDAVKQWVFTPTLLGGVPIPVIMTVTVGFKLR